MFTHIKEVIETLRGFKKEKEEKKEIAAGQMWILRDGSPWGEDFRQHPVVRILDVRDGWVRYYMNTIFEDNRMKIDTFYYCYRRIETPEKNIGELR